eukprot:1179467-Prorocentrum_minimum.AAC.3
MQVVQLAGAWFQDLAALPTNLSTHFDNSRHDNGARDQVRCSVPPGSRVLRDCEGLLRGEVRL